MNDTPPPDDTLSRRIELIRSSLRCFGLSLAGLIPIVGLPFALIASAQAVKAKKKSGNDWNPAAGYLRAAYWISPLSFLSTALFLGLVLIMSFMQTSATCSPGYG